MKTKVTPELRELRRRVREYENLLVRWHKAIGKPSWKEGDTEDEIASRMLHVAGTIRLERSLSKLNPSKVNRHARKKRKR